MSPFIVPIVLFISSTAVLITYLYLHYSTRHKERMALIESGRDASIFEERKTRSSLRSLKYGLFLLFIGVGLFVGLLIENTLSWIPEASVSIPLVLISAGAALLYFYRFVRDHDLDESGREIV